MSAGARTSRWLREACAEVLRGRHVIVHGAVRDSVLYDGRTAEPRDALVAALRDVLGYSIVAHYDLAGGFSFGSPEEAARAHAIYADPAPADESDDSGGPLDARVRDDGAHGTADPGRARAAAAVRELRRAVDRRPLATADPETAFPAIRSLLASTDSSTAVVLGGAELLFSEIDRSDHPGLLLARLQAAVTDAAETPEQRPTPRRNVLILLTHALDAVPAAIRKDPRFAAVAAGRPDFAERASALAAIAPLFYGADQLPADELPGHARDLAVLADGGALRDLEALRRSSHLERIPVGRGRQLVLRVAQGVERDHWEALDKDRLQQAFDELRRHVVGQDAALREIARRLVSARVGIRCLPQSRTATRRPRMKLFLVGASGVGKTELAKALARFVFGDEAAVVRLDMSEFSDPASVNRLKGSPPGYVGFEHGGELTTRVRERPFSVVLFDEIEKAHAVIWDSLLHVIDDGRLTDGHGNTVSFADTIILFTSNLGTPELAERLREGHGLEHREIDDHCRRAVRDFLSRPRDADGLGRPELWGRLQSSVLVFDLLRPEAVAGIVAKMVGWYAEDAEMKGHLLLEIDPTPFARAVAGRLGPPGTWDGRAIAGIMEDTLEQPLAEQVLELDPPPRSRGRVTLGNDGRARLELL